LIKTITSKRGGKGKSKVEADIGEGGNEGTKTLEIRGETHVQRKKHRETGR